MTQPGGESPKHAPANVPETHDKQKAETHKKLTDLRDFFEKKNLKPRVDEIAAALQALETPNGAAPSQAKLEEWENAKKALEDLAKKKPKEFGMLSSVMDQLKNFQENLNMSSADLRGLIEVLKQIPGFNVLIAIVAMLANAPSARKKYVESLGVKLKSSLSEAEKKDLTAEQIKAQEQAREKPLLNQIDTQAKAIAAHRNQPGYAFEEHAMEIANRARTTDEFKKADMAMSLADMAKLGAAIMDEELKKPKVVPPAQQNAPEKKPNTATA